MGRVEPTNALKKTKSSTNPDRGKLEPGSRMRTKQTIKRLNMYRGGKPKRNAEGKIIQAAPFQKRLASGTMARVEPSRRWFGNTKTITQDALQNFKEVMKLRNPYEVVLRQTKLPVSLLNEKKLKSKSDLLAHESYSYVFGAKKTT
uniref:Nucleolar GTP-binding protein 2 n=1 Tax=Lepeophtheirus salmonis TaxID=72036 RepID=D3PHG1_LEPSM|nr:Nucleolar GTP-binding protein 2 [Lepeophtheirus salmonis]